MATAIYFFTAKGIGQNQSSTRLALGMFMAISRRMLAAGLLLIGSIVRADGVPDDCAQLIVGIGPTWNSMHGRLQLFERARGEPWKIVSAAVPVLFGKDGVAWGSGLAGQAEPGLRKKERDGRAPAGIFRIGKIYTYDAQLPPGSDYPFHQVTRADAWVELAVEDTGPGISPADLPYRWLVEIRHNSDPPVPGAGSAIFFHIRRGLNRPTSGCTTMAEGDLVRLITWLRADSHPCYALLPAAEYQKKWRFWNLPEPEKAATK